MSIKAFPLNQQEYSYNAQDVMKYYAGRNSGVFETGDNLKVSANGGLELRVNTGMGWLAKDYVASVAFWNESVEYLMVDAGHDTYNRIDLVVVSWNFIQQEQNPKLIIRKGTPASSPAIPALVNNSSTIEIALARINVAKGAITLSDSNIVDLRGNDTYCPMVYDEQTIREAFRKCVGYADGVNKISDFPSVIPMANDKLLIEQGGLGKSCNIGDLGINMNLLWANSAIYSEFPSQNIILDLTQYKYIIVEVAQEPVTGNTQYIRNRHKNLVVKNEEIFLFSTNNLGFYAAQNFYYASRFCKFDNSKIEIGDCYMSKVNSSSAAETQINNKNCIPYKIYGVK